MKFFFGLLVFYLSLIGRPALATDELRVVYTYESQTFGRIIEEFGRRTGIKVSAGFQSQYDIKAKLMTSMESAEMPNAIIMPADHAGLHKFIKYSEVDPRLFKASISERIWNAGASDGKIFGAPVIQGNHLMLFYNKAYVKNPAPNWETMFRQKAEFDAKGVATIAWSYDESYWFLPFLGAYGGWPIVDGKLQLNTPSMVAALDFYRSLYVKGLIIPRCNYRCTVDTFKASKVAYIINGGWSVKEIYEALGDNLGFTSIPMVQNLKIRPAFSTHIIAFPNEGLTSSKRAILMQLIDYIQSPMVQRQLWDVGGFIPVEQNALDYAQKNAKGHLKQMLELMADTKPVPNDQVMTFVWDAIDKGIIRHREGTLDSPGAADYMQRLAERHIRNAEQQAPIEVPTPSAGP